MGQQDPQGSSRFHHSNEGGWTRGKWQQKTMLCGWMGQMYVWQHLSMR